MEIIFSDEFKKEYRKIKDKLVRSKILKSIKKLSNNPEVGKPLRHNLKGHRVLRVKPFRIVYRLEEDKVIINCFDHRKDVYK